MCRYINKTINGPTYTNMQNGIIKFTSESFMIKVQTKYCNFVHNTQYSVRNGFTFVYKNHNYDPISLLISKHCSALQNVN